MAALLEGGSWSPRGLHLVAYGDLIDQQGDFADGGGFCDVHDSHAPDVAVATYDREGPVFGDAVLAA